ncbi:MAG: ferritin-like domain-containing protein [Candidatus Poseidoniales archaeon]
MTQNLITTLNEALGWELRAINMYAHFAAIVRGLHRIQFAPMFQGEATESLAHADVVRRAIVKLDGMPVTERNSTPISNSTSYEDMLQSALETETKAAEVYGTLLKMLEDYDDGELYDAIEQIYLAELRSIEDLRLITSS